MIDVFAGALIAGLAFGWLAAVVWQHRKASSVERLAGPPRVIAVETDGPIQPEDLVAVRVCLTAFYQAQCNEAWRQVLDQVAHDEAADGVDVVEDAANERRAS